MSTRRIDDAVRALARDGRLTPDAVIEAAKKKTSPLHECFTWDDKIAGHKHRLQEARALIQSVRVRTTVTTHKARAPEFVRDPAVDGERVQGYVSLGKLRTEEDLARDAVVAEFSRAASALSRARAVASALGLEDEIEELRQEVVALADRVQQPTANA